ncbi:MAG TPA: molybdenum cofactor guanylyltransferase [Saprospiraceae bacterium]|nr:molybdenum cofactor guanylyltransferase [Saprospiraceae bacterium]
MKKHQKHTHLIKRNNDTFAPNEIAILGTKCDIISNLVTKVATQLTNYKLAYFDASHAKDIAKNSIEKYTFHHQGNVQIQSKSEVNKFNQRIQFSQYDYVFINGNHYQASKQILILDANKEASVLKRLSQLDSIQFVIKLDESTPFFSFLEEKYPQIKNLSCYTIDEIDKISNHIENLIKEKIAPIKGLVLNGGKSTRMRHDKSVLNYHGKPQKEHAKELLEHAGMPTYFSVQKSLLTKNEITDTFLHLGPFGGICSAFQKDPNSAWFVLATDVPFVNENIIELLLQNRNPSKIATAIKGKNKSFVEPLITIYEPKAYPKLLAYLSQGYSCPRKVLINSEVEIIEVDDDFIRNINTPEEFEMAKKEITNL